VAALPGESPRFRALAGETVPEGWLHDHSEWPATGVLAGQLARTSETEAASASSANCARRATGGNPMRLHVLLEPETVRVDRPDEPARCAD